MTTLVLLVAGGLAAWFVWHKFTVWRLSLPKRRALASAERAKAKEELKRPLAQRVHTHLPDAAVQRLMRWSPQPDRFWHRWFASRVTVARRGLFGGPVRIKPAQHIAAVGTTGCGKTSVLRALGAWALRQPDWQVVCLDGKWGASVAPYRRHCRVLDDLGEIEAFLSDLVTREFPARGRMTRRPHLVLIADESRLFNSLSAAALSDLVEIMQTGRELGVHVWAGVQDFKTSSIPSEIRMLFTCKVVGLVPTAEDSHVIFKELAAAGWRPDKLERAGQLLVWEPERKKARVCFGLWMSETALAGARNRVCLVKVPPLPAPVRMPVRSGVRTPSDLRIQAPNEQRTNTRPPVADDVLTALMTSPEPLGVRALARATGRSPAAVHAAVNALAADGAVTRTTDGYTIPLHATEEE
ncbi:helix-turn-helix domain-containing protein [Streptomyces sp. NBC_01092]|uniref:helix-turn-helix domain-containing protein n=1 Tax=Streptomyces sp. NBC_01092 TaxID=2903748 RepID=UPI0038679D34|nr:helix-turn-helix domain-containing protein [Streptomyces sp. NBC_01092]